MSILMMLNNSNSSFVVCLHIIALLPEELHDFSIGLLQLRPQLVYLVAALTILSVPCLWVLDH